MKWIGETVPVGFSRIVLYSSGKKIVSIWRVVTGQPKSDSLEDLPGRSGASSRLF